MRYLLVLLVAGCTTRFVYTPEQEGKYRQDSFYCEQIAAKQMNPGDKAQMWDSCMYAAGWRTYQRVMPTRSDPAPAPPPRAP